MTKKMEKKKKKVKIAKKSKKLKEPQMSGHEAILVYKVNVLEEKLRDMKLQIRAWEEKNERHLARNNKLKSEQNILMERLLEQSRIVEKTWEDEEVIEKTAVLNTLQEKWTCGESKENELGELQRQITEVEKEIEVLKKDIDYWTFYREKDHSCHATYIEVLKQQLMDMNTCFSYLHVDFISSDWPEHEFKAIFCQPGFGFCGSIRKTRSIVLLEDNISIRIKSLGSGKQSTTQNILLAISQVPKQYKQEIQDNDWLKQEVAHQQKEFENLYKHASELELSNLETMEQLFECKTNDLKIVRNIFLNQCSEFDDMQASPGILEMDLTKLYENYPQFPALIHSPDDTDNISKTVFLTQEDPMDFMKLGPIEWKLLAVCGKPAPLHIPEEKSQQELNALKRYPSDWPVTKPMLRGLKSDPK